MLATYKKKSIKLAELESMTKTFLPSYQAFSETILELEHVGILVMVKSKGRTSRPSCLLPRS